MTVAIYSESPADEAALRIIVDAALVQATKSAVHERIRPYGWTSVVGGLPTIIRHLHFNRPDVDGLIVVVDSDKSPVHEPSHEVAGDMAGCRLCDLRRAVDAVTRHLTPLPQRRPLRIALGVAAPALEAWLRARQDVHISELAWARALASGQFQFSTQSLKRDLYGTDRPSLTLETERMVAAAQEIATDLALLERRFPAGFGALITSLRSW